MINNNSDVMESGDLVFDDSEYGFHDEHDFDDDLAALEDFHICGFDDNEPSELPDYDFDDFGADEFPTCDEVLH